MTDPNRPIIDTRTTVLGTQPPVAATVSSGGSTRPAQPAPAPIIPTASSSTTVKATASTPVSTTVPDAFKGSSNQELIDYLRRKISEHKPLSDEDVAKIRRRQKAESIISGVSDAVRAVSNMVFTSQYAPNMYNPSDSMTEKARKRFEKEKAEREAEDDRYFNYAITLGKLRDAERDRGLQAWQIEQSFARQDRAFDAGRKDKEDEVAFRDKSFERQGEWHKEEGDRWERQLTEGARQFDVSAANERARINMEGQRLAHAMKEGQMTFNLGSGNGNVTLTLDKLNAQTVSRIYSTLPESVRSQVQGKPIAREGRIVGYEPLTTEEMLIAIGANVETSPATQNAIKQVAGLGKGNKPKGYDY